MSANPSDLIALRRTGQGWWSSVEKNEEGLEDQTDQMENATGEKDELEDTCMLENPAEIEHDYVVILLKGKGPGNEVVFGKDLDVTDTMGSVILEKGRKGECICRCGGCFSTRARDEVSNR